jgi:hypothetical protein
MSCLVLYTDRMVKQKQNDLLREIESYRLVKAIAQRRPQHLQKAAAVLRRAMAGLTRDLPMLRSARWKAKS